MSTVQPHRHPIIFLDFDGVLQTPALDDWAEMEHCDGLLVALAALPALRIVVTSTHREGRSVPDVSRMLPALVAPRVIGTTPVTARGRAQGGRQAEIEAWLQENPDAFDQYVAVDDEAQLYKPNCAWLVRTHPLVGWDELTTEKVIEGLSGKTTRH